MNGGTLYLRGKRWEETLKQVISVPVGRRNQLTRGQVDTLIATPSVLSRYRRRDYPNITMVVTGGEPCPQSYAKQRLSFIMVC